MKWKLLGSLTLGCILTIASVNAVRLFGQLPNGYGPNNPPPNGQSYDKVRQTPALLNEAPFYGRPPSNLNAEEHVVPYQVTTIGPDGQPITSTHYKVLTVSPHGNEDRKTLHESQDKLHDPDASEYDKKEARAAIEKFLGEEFERDQKMRREQVSRLEEQVSKLRKQLEKREQSKNKIIELRMQLIENEAEGLSFPESFNELQRFVPYQPMPGSAYPAPGAPYQTYPTIPPSGELTTRDLINLRNRSSGTPIPNMVRPPEYGQAPMIGR